MIGMICPSLWVTATSVLFALLVSSSAPAQVHVLSPDNYDRLVPAGKEVDAIYGDIVLRNGRLTAVIAHTNGRRDANSRTTNIGGSLLDLTTTENSNDLLTVFTPADRRYRWRLLAEDGGAGSRGSAVVRFAASSTRRLPSARLTYRLEPGSPALEVITEFLNDGDERLRFLVRDVLVVEGPSFDRVESGMHSYVWAYDPWFRQAYGLLAPGHAASVEIHKGDITTITWRTTSGDRRFSLDPGERLVFTRHLFPAADSIALRSVRAEMSGQETDPVMLEVVDTDGRAVDDAVVKLMRDDGPYGSGRTNPDGSLRLQLPRAEYDLTVSSPGRGSASRRLSARDDARSAPAPLRVVLPAGTRIIGGVIDAGGHRIPAKIAFEGIDGTPTPDFGPKVLADRIRDLIYTPDGRFSIVVPAGRYLVTASRGTEYEIARQTLEVTEGGPDVHFRAALRRSVRTPGWIAADFHGHTTASGDTAASPRGRVLNLAAEGIEFAPCTEHNRIDTYAPIIEAMDLGAWLATTSGIELTGVPFPLNHHNAFPLRMVPRTQGNGAPDPDDDPAAQIRRLAEWDGGSEKLVQQNHPDIGWLFFDADGDGHRDGGHGDIAGYMDVMEIFSPSILDMNPYMDKPALEEEVEADSAPGIERHNNRIFNWLQLLNQGQRIPGVANTDAHHNHHGSGGVRNYVMSSTDDPALIDPLEIVRNAEQGHLVMTNGPFLEVTLAPESAHDEALAYPGDTVAAPTARVTLKIRVQCPDWFDIDRVQVLLNGRIEESLSFTRYNDPGYFSDGVVKFEQELTVDLKRDTHLIVVAAHKKKLLFPVMGPKWGDKQPMAISNPIFVDVDGGGFTPSGDPLGHPLPVKEPRDR